MDKIKLNLQEYGRLSEPQSKIPKVLKGEKGDTPVITASKSGTTTTIYADGVPIAQIEDGEGRMPEITAEKVGTVTTIYVDGEPVAQISDGTDGKDGKDGTDGHTPVITTSRSGKVVTILSDGVSIGTISDGTDGQDGQDGHSPQVTASKVGKVTTVSVDGTPIVTINDGNDGSDGADGTDGKSAYEYAQDGGYTGTEAEFAQKLAEEYVTDVQVNGTSVLTDGVANVPLATDSSVGVVRGNAGRGVRVLLDGSASHGSLFIDKSSVAGIKNAMDDYRPVVPSNQHAASFYGLAKAAGDSTQSASSNAVGAYTDNAKVAIQKMLGIYEAPFELITQMTLSERTQLDITTDMNGQPLALRSLIMEIYYPADLEQETSGYGRFRVYDADGKCLNTESGRYTGITNAAYRVLYIERKSNLVLSNFTRLATTGGYGGWSIKFSTNNGNPGFRTDLGDIVRIAAVSGDYEPAGAVVTIYGQRAN